MPPRPEAQPSLLGRALSFLSHPFRGEYTTPNQGILLTAAPPVHPRLVTGRDWRILHRTASALEWVHSRYGEGDAFERYIALLDENDVIKRSCERLQALCNLDNALQDDNDHGSPVEVENLKELLQARVDTDRDRYSALPLTRAWINCSGFHLCCCTVCQKAQ